MVILIQVGAKNRGGTIFICSISLLQGMMALILCNGDFVAEFESKLPVPTQIIMIFALMVKRLCSISIIDRFYDSITLGGTYVR